MNKNFFDYHDALKIQGALKLLPTPIPTITGLNQSIYSYHMTQAGRNRVKGFVSKKDWKQGCVYGNM